MNEPTQEQIKEFWEWCGFKHDVPFPELAKRKDILNPERFTKEQWYISGVYCGSVPDIDLNNLFKYAVPKVWELCIDSSELYEKMDVWLREYVFNDKDPALALFWAIWEVIKGTNQS